MAGSVDECCWDWYDSTYYASSPGTDPRGPASGLYRAIRGGSWGGDAYFCRAANRNYNYKGPGSENAYMGFRLVLSPGP